MTKLQTPLPCLAASLKDAVSEANGPLMSDSLMSSNEIPRHELKGIRCEVDYSTSHFLVAVSQDFPD